jgi:hypothetical protein
LANLLRISEYSGCVRSAKRIYAVNRWRERKKRRRKKYSRLKESVVVLPT